MHFILLGLGFILNPPTGLAFGTVLVIALILGLLHGATPDEHTWPITFSYAIGSYSTKGGMKSGFSFSAGFTVQRAILTTLGFAGLAVIYKQYNLDGPVYVLVGIAMVLAGLYILNKRRYLHVPIDALFGSKGHHTENAKRLSIEETHPKSVPTGMAFVHGVIAGWGFGAYSTIITFVLAPQAPSLIYAPLVGLCFGIGTMIMQIIFGAIFANLARVKKLSEAQLAQVGRKTAGSVLYYGGAAFALIGIAILIFPMLDNIAISTGNPIPNTRIVA